jgi:hypothetical protein
MSYIKCPVGWRNAQTGMFLQHRLVDVESQPRAVGQDKEAVLEWRTFDRAVALNQLEVERPPAFRKSTGDECSDAGLGSARAAAKIETRMNAALAPWHFSIFLPFNSKAPHGDIEGKSVSLSRNKRPDRESLPACDLVPSTPVFLETSIASNSIPPVSGCLFIHTSN